jgi:hypothetical protein
MELGKREILKVLDHEMNVLGEKILEKDERTGNRRGDLHTALWVLKERVDELTEGEGKDSKISKRKVT